MKTLQMVIVLVALSAFASGCTSVAYKSGGAASAPAFAAAASRESQGEPSRDRMLIWKAYLTIDVWNVSNAINQAVGVAEKNGGYVEQKSDSGEESGTLRLRIPMKSFTNTVSCLESLGTVQSRYVSSQDVTEEYVDVDARLKNRIVLRDRLRQLLDKATEVKDILAIETELNRIQGEIDSMEGRIKLLKGQVDLATVELHLNRKRVLGPLGYVFKGIGWTIKKLFVIRD